MLLYKVHCYIDLLRAVSIATHPFAMQVMDKHLQLLAQQHLETKFVKVG
jgi:hypothetical protein